MPIVIPKGAEKPDYEAEFGVVIGKRGKNISPNDAMDYVAGYLIFHDATDRAWQRKTSQYLIGKTIDSGSSFWDSSGTWWVASKPRCSSSPSSCR